jgi:hypothetical protein
MTQTTDPDDDQQDVLITPVSPKWLWSMLLFLVICFLLASLCPFVWPDG